MTKGVDYYLVGDMCSPIWSTADTSFALTKVNGDNNHYTGTFRLTGQRLMSSKSTTVTGTIILSLVLPLVKEHRSLEA